MQLEKVVLVYSALHTGTWFACKAITTGMYEAQTRSDNWVKTVHHETIEQLPNPEVITLDWANDLVSRHQTLDKPLDDYVNVLILQAHQRTDSLLYRQLCHKPLSVPTVIPVRNPLLALHTRVWREAASRKQLRQENEWTRSFRIEDQLNSLERILSIPDSNAFFFPIDAPTLADESTRLELVTKLLDYCGIQSTPETKEFAKNWAPVNATPGGAPYQRQHYDIKDKDFVPIKQMLLDNDIQGFKEAMPAEYNGFVKWLDDRPHIRERLEMFGYTDLPSRTSLQETDDDRWYALSPEARKRRIEWWDVMSAKQEAEKLKWWNQLPKYWKKDHFELQNKLPYEMLKYHAIGGTGMVKFLDIAMNELPEEGDILIAGTFRGGDVMALRCLLPEPRRIIVIDSFEGLAEPLEQDHNDELIMKQGAMCCSLEDYRQNFERENILPPDEIYQMWITPESLEEVPRRPLAMLFTDLDHYAPAKACFEHFIPWVLPEGVVLTHDYNFRLTPGVTKAAEEYAPGQWESIYGSFARLQR